MREGGMLGPVRVVVVALEVELLLRLAAAWRWDSWAVLIEIALSFARGGKFLAIKMEVGWFLTGSLCRNPPPWWSFVVADAPPSSRAFAGGFLMTRHPCVAAENLSSLLKSLMEV